MRRRALLLSLARGEGAPALRCFALVSPSTALREREPSSEARWRFAFRRASLASRRPLLRAERSRVACCFWDFFDGKGAASSWRVAGGRLRGALSIIGRADPHVPRRRPAVSSTSQLAPSLPKLHDFFAPGGVLARSSLPYEFRRGQLEMAQAVERALSEKRHLIVEAGTGTGKTLAYLLPALRWDAASG